MAFVNTSASLTNGQTLELDLSDSQGTVLVRVTGTWSGTIFPEGTIDGTNWFQVNVSDYDAADGQVAIDIQANNIFAANGAGLFKFRLNASAISGTAVCSLGASGAVTIVSANQSIQYVNASSLPLPSGAATEAKQTQPGVDIGDVTVNNASGGAAVNIQDGGNSITVDGSVTANAGTNLNTSALALEAGGNLASINTKTLAAGQGTMAASSPVVIASNQTSIPVVATLASSMATIGVLAANSGVDIGDVTVNNSTGANAVNIQDGGNSITVDGSITVTQATGTNLHVVVDSGTITTVGTVTSVTAIANALPAGNNNIGDVDVVTLPSIPTGVNSIGQVTANAGTNLNTSLLALESTQSAQSILIGAVTETAPASDTASSGLNGRLQRIAQRLTSLIALLPTSLGQKTMANSFAVTMASDQSSIPFTQTKVSLTAASPATTSVGVASASAVASNANRKGLIIVNISTANVSFGIGATAVVGSGITLLPGGVWNMDADSFSTSAINAIATAAASSISIQEFT